MTRNAVGGAVAGGTAGAIVGHQQDKAAERAVASGSAATDAGLVALKKKIGPDNVKGLQQRMQCQHEEAYRTGMGATPEQMFKPSNDPILQAAITAGVNTVGFDTPPID